MTFASPFALVGDHEDAEHGENARTQHQIEIAAQPR